MADAKKELCTIRIMFPAESDEQALGVKKQITELLKDNQEATVQFGLQTMPDTGAPPMR